jgi:hypothetical protein
VRIDGDSREWEISTDGGEHWTSTGVKATADASLFAADGIDNSQPDHVRFTLADGTVITAWRLPQFGIVFETPAIFAKGAVQVIPYALTGGVTIVKEFHHTAEGWSVSFDASKREMSITAPGAFNAGNYRDTISLWLSDGAALMVHTFPVAGDYLEAAERPSQVAETFMEEKRLPRSFIGPSDGITDSHQLAIVEQGVVLYDMAVLMKALLLQPERNREKITGLVNALRDGVNVRSNSDFTYPGATVPSGQGYFYKIIHVDAKWLSGQTDPITGENAWVANAMAAVHATYPGSPVAADAFTLLLQLGRAMVYLQDASSGLVRMAPMVWHNYDYAGINYHETASVENNLSCIPALRYLSEHAATAAERTMFADALTRLEDAVIGMYNTGGGYFYTGKNLVNGAPNTRFATDCQTWMVLAFGAERLDQLMLTHHGLANASAQLLRKTLDVAGVQHEGAYVGLDFYDRATVVSHEWSLGFLAAARAVLARGEDAVLREATRTIGAYIQSCATGQGLLTYTDSPISVDTGHGWTTIPLMHSLASTAWNLFEALEAPVTPFDI